MLALFVELVAVGAVEGALDCVVVGFGGAGAGFGAVVVATFFGVLAWGHEVTPAEAINAAAVAHSPSPPLRRALSSLADP